MSTLTTHWQFQDQSINQSINSSFIEGKTPSDTDARGVEKQKGKRLATGPHMPGLGK